MKGEKYMNKNFHELNITAAELYRKWELICPEEDEENDFDLEEFKTLVKSTYYALKKTVNGEMIDRRMIPVVTSMLNFVRAEHEYTTELSAAKTITDAMLFDAKPFEENGIRLSLMFCDDDDKPILEKPVLIYDIESGDMHEVFHAMDILHENGVEPWEAAIRIIL